MSETRLSTPFNKILATPLPACTLHQAWAATLWKGAVADNFRPSGATCYTIGRMVL